MSKRGQRTNGTVGNGSNTRLVSLDALLDKFVKLQTEEDRLMEKYIQPIRDKKSKVKAEAKSDYEIPTEAFNARVAWLLIENRSDNDEVVLALNELLQATPVGKNVDLVELAERVAAKKEEKKKAAEAAKNEEADV